MFFISKNPQASMAEVLTKAKKYINGEEALISKKGSSSTHEEKSGTDKRQGRSSKRQRDQERSPKKTENGPRKGVEASEIAWVHLSPSGDDSISLNGSVMESSTTPPKPCSPRVTSAQAIQPTRPQRPGAQQLSLTNSTTPPRPCSPRVSSARAIQPNKPQRPEAQ